MSDTFGLYHLVISLLRCIIFTPFFLCNSTIIIVPFSYCNSNYLNRNDDVKYYKITLFSLVHPELVAGRISNDLTCIEIERQWREIAVRLNAYGGATKTWRDWKKVMYYYYIICLIIINSSIIRYFHKLNHVF
jgi:hypothetical protein